MKLRQIIWEQKQYADAVVMINNYTFKLHKHIVGTAQFPQYVTDLNGKLYNQSAINTAFAISYDIINAADLPFDALISAVHLRNELGLTTECNIDAAIQSNMPHYYTAPVPLPINDYALGIYGLRIWDDLNYTLTPKQAAYAIGLTCGNLVKYQILCAAYFRTGNKFDSALHDQQSAQYVKLIQSENLTLI